MIHLEFTLREVSMRELHGILSVGQPMLLCELEV